MRSCLVALLLPAFLAAQEKQPNQTLVALLKELSSSDNLTTTSQAFAAKMLQEKKKSDEQTSALIADIATHGNSPWALLINAEKLIKKMSPAEARLVLDVGIQKYQQLVYDDEGGVSLYPGRKYWWPFKFAGKLREELGDKRRALNHYEHALKFLVNHRNYLESVFGKDSRWLRGLASEETEIKESMEKLSGEKKK